jgi:gliding motility-associated-like protein
MNGILRSTSLYKYISLLIVTLCALQANAQLPVCSGPGSGLIYYLNGANIWQWDPQQPFSTSNPWVNTLPAPPGAIGLAVSENINGPGPSPTFYAVDGTNYWYWDGATWVNTGQTAGAVNPGGGGGFIYSLEGSGGNIYKYDATGNATLLITISDFQGGGPYDLVGDCEGNFYILSTTANWLRKYNSSGVLVQTWTTSGGQIGSAGGGMAIIGNTVYYDGTGGLWSGPMVGSTITFTNLGNSLGPSDFANCSLGGQGTLTGLNQTYYNCGTGIPTDLVSSGQESDTISWNVASGNAVITGAGDSVSITLTTTSVIYSNSTTACGATRDTFTIIVPTATLSAGADDTVYGCGVFRDTLQASVTGLTSGVTYTYVWTPSNAIIQGGNSLAPIVDVGVSNSFIITVTTTQGGCTWADTVNITPIDVNVVADYTYDINYGCAADTVVFTNNSQFGTNYLWRFGDGTTDTAANPTHIYTAQGVYLVTLVVTNGICYDSLITTIDLNHPLDAQFTVDTDTICQGQTITMTNTSTTTTINGIDPTFTWTYGDGTSSNNVGGQHQYDHPGTYEIVLVVQDFVPCRDTAKYTVVVDSQSTVVILHSDSLICAGQKVDFEGVYLEGGMLGYTWDMGDGIIVTNEAPLSHTYEYPGTYQVTLNVDYNVCNDGQDQMLVTVHPFPSLNLGEDTSFCPNAGPLVLNDLDNMGNAAATWLWNTGATNAMISVTAPGTYYTTVTIDGCSNTDSVTVWKDCYIDIPNSFTPNGDNMNDHFLPRQLLSRSVKTFKMNIFNRWGQLIYDTTNIGGRGWDGKLNEVPQPEGVFVYLIEVSFADGRSEKYQGNVTLLR